VHKAQGLTLERAHVDLGDGAFAPGQLYVALSRCTSLDGLTLERPIRAADVITDLLVRRFLNRARAESQDRARCSTQ